MVNDSTKHSAVTEPSPELACSAPPAPVGNKTTVLKWASDEPPPGFLDRKTFAFQPRGSSIQLMSMEAATKTKLASIIGIADDPSPLCGETRRRIAVIADHVFSAGWTFDTPPMRFAADELAKITAYINAFPKPLGYDYMPVLHREAELLIPSAIECPYDVGEMLRSFFIWRKNFIFLHDPLLIVGLFLVFFRKTLEMNYFREFRYDLAVEEIMSWKTEFEIRENVNHIIHRGIE